MTKAEIRREIARRRKAVDLRKLEETAALALKKLQALDCFQRANAIGAYMPLHDEMDITPLFRRGNKPFFIPAFDPDGGGYRMARYTPELKKGKFGIPEPVQPQWAQPDEMDLILVPGLAFDRLGGRLGRGGGFYDRLLPLYSARRIGMACGFQIVDAVPTEPHDIRMDALLTETDFFDFSTNNRQTRRSELS